MSLLCDETRHYLEETAPLWAGTRSDIPTYSALSHEVIQKIPDREKRSTPCQPNAGDEGVDIHEASSTARGGFYHMTGFTLGRFVFSISGEAARKYLPHHYDNYPAVAN